MLALKPAKAALAALALICLAATACVQTPTVRLAQRASRGPARAGAVIDVVIEIKNPNSSDTQLRALTAETTFAGTYRLPPIVIHPNQWLPSGQATLVHIPTTLP